MKKSCVSALMILCLVLAGCGVRAEPLAADEAPEVPAFELQVLLPENTGGNNNSAAGNDALNDDDGGSGIVMRLVTVTDGDMRDYTLYRAEATSTNSYGTKKTRVYIGYRLSDVIGAAIAKTSGESVAFASESDAKTGNETAPDAYSVTRIDADDMVSETGVAVEGDDGYYVTLSGKDALRDTTLVAVSEDGVAFGGTGPWLAPCASKNTPDYVKNLSKIEVLAPE